MLIDGSSGGGAALRDNGGGGAATAVGSGGGGAVTAGMDGGGAAAGAGTTDGGGGAGAADGGGGAGATDGGDFGDVAAGGGGTVVGEGRAVDFFSAGVFLLFLMTLKVDPVCAGIWAKRNAVAVTTASDTWETVARYTPSVALDDPFADAKRTGRLCQITQATDRLGTHR